jgi:predicted acyl esterase
MTSKLSSMQVPITKLSPPEVGVNGYQGFNPRTEILPEGWNGFDSAPLPCEIQVEHDFAFTVRDGTKLYADIYRPPNCSEKIPALLCWGPFGKKFNGLTSLKIMTPWNLGIPDRTLSGLETFEGLDPADWVSKNYAVINVDSRGATDSEGIMAIMGSQEAQDGYDVIEAIAKLDWCSGNVGMAGNSHLAIIQWFIAALNPPSLKAIAPWEACGDLYREQFARGGIYNGDLFDNLITKYLIKGRNGIESFREMYEGHPLANDWWNDKRPDLTKIRVPAYLTGTWSNTMHGMGVIRGWREMNTEKKWLRWHGTQEWRDLWGNREGQAELLQFFDHYLKDIENDWESTPKVRLAVMRFGEQDPISNIVQDDLPLPSTDYRKLYFSSASSLDIRPPTVSSSLSYDPNSKTDFASFTYTFPQKTRLIGLPKAVVYMSCADHDDMDIYICLRKLSASGEPMLNLNLPWSDVPVSKIADIPEDKRTEVILYMGPVGILRASHREIDQSRSMHENWPYHPHENEEKVPPGQIVKLEVGIWAMGIEYEAGESIRVQVSGINQGMHFSTETCTDNKGRHLIHMGGDYPSHVILPFV